MGVLKGGTNRFDVLKMWKSKMYDFGGKVSKKNPLMLDLEPTLNISQYTLEMPTGSLAKQPTLGLTIDTKTDKDSCSKSSKRSKREDLTTPKALKWNHSPSHGSGYAQGQYTPKSRPKNLIS